MKKFNILYNGEEVGTAEVSPTATHDVILTISAQKNGRQLAVPGYIGQPDSLPTMWKTVLGSLARKLGIDPTELLIESDDARSSLWQQPRSGRRVWAFDSRPEDICLEEIAYGLREGRFANQTLGLYTYTVAQHSVMGSDIGDQSPHARMAKLLHDAHEAIMKDMPKPLRMDPGMAAYNEACDARQRAINVWAGLHSDAHLTQDVKDADAIMLSTERRDLMAPNEHVWSGMKKPLDQKIVIWSQPVAVDEFLALFAKLAVDVCRDKFDDAMNLRVLHQNAMEDDS